MMMGRRHRRTAARAAGRILLPALLCLAGQSGADSSSPLLQDPHTSEAGFFDIHVCNWPERELFFMSLFSTPRFDEVRQVEVFFPNAFQPSLIETHVSIKFNHLSPLGTGWEGRR